MERKKAALASISHNDGNIIVDYDVMDQTAVELPVDYSAHAFFTGLKIPSGGYEPNQGKSAIMKMELSKDSNGRKPENMFAHIYNSPTRDHAAGRTIPFTIYHEAADILSALMQAYFEDQVPGKKQGPEKWGERTFDILAQELSEKMPEDLDTDRQSRTMANNLTVQRIMLSHFDEDLKKRLISIWNLIHDNGNGALIAPLVNTMKKLDGILVELRDYQAYQKQMTPDAANVTDVPDTQQNEIWRHKLNNLYFDLLCERRSLLVYPDGSSTGKVKMRFVLPDTPENETLLNEMYQILDTYNKSTGQEERDRFAVLYKKYMDRRFPESEVDLRAKSFLSDYQRLKYYLREDSEEEVFCEDVRRMVFWNIRKMFKDLTGQQETWNYEFDPYFAHAQDIFTYVRIENFCRDVEIGFHDVFMCLKEATVIANWWNNVSENYANILERTLVLDMLNHIFRSNYQRVIKNMRNCRSILATNYPHVPRLASASPVDIHNFVEAYARGCAHVFPENRVDDEVVSQWVRMGIEQEFRDESALLGSFLSLMASEKDILIAELRLVVMDLAEQLIEQLRKEHRYIKEYQ